MDRTTPSTTTTGHRAHVAQTQAIMDKFLNLLQQLQPSHGTYMFSMDLYAAFEDFAGVELPTGFQREFGRRLNRACVDGRLPFKRKPKTRARLAAFEGIDTKELEAVLSRAALMDHGHETPPSALHAA